LKLRRTSQASDVASLPWSASLSGERIAVPFADGEISAYAASVTEGTRATKPSDLVQGTFDLLILKILALEALNGWAISLRLKQVSNDVLQVSDGSLYPALHKLEQQGWIAAEWRPSENNRRAKFYSLTPIRPQVSGSRDGELAPARRRHLPRVKLKEA
jgi:PadR family transcriptional regulator PadR